MRDLKLHEQFEIEVLDKLNSSRLLDPLVFCGGTMLRLCYGLDRYSVDLDFWIVKKVNFNIFFNKLLKCLSRDYTIKDSVIKHYTILFEISKDGYPRNLKIEIRKEIKDLIAEDSIAYSKFSNKQVLLKTVKLQDMMESKIKTFLNRGEIRDCFDIEFFIKKGVDLKASPEELKKLLININALTKTDYNVKLGSIIDAEYKKYYKENNFKILKMLIKEIIS